MVVLREVQGGFTTPEMSFQVRNRRFEEAWIFGRPETREEQALWEALQPTLAAGTPLTRIHRIE